MPFTTRASEIFDPINFTLPTTQASICSTFRIHPSFAGVLIPSYAESATVVCYFSSLFAAMVEVTGVVNNNLSISIFSILVSPSAKVFKLQ